MKLVSCWVGNLEHELLVADVADGAGQGHGVALVGLQT